MKAFNLYVPDDKVKFIGELLDNLGIDWDITTSVRGKVKADSKQGSEVAPKTYEVDEEARKKAAKVREDSLKDVISRIEEMRKGNK